MSTRKIDMPALVEHVQREGAKLDAQPPLAGARRSRGSEPLPDLEETWDVWRREPLATHRGGLAGRAVLLFKRTLLTVLAPHDTELLRGQREFNRHVTDELTRTRQQLLALQAELRRLKSTPPDATPAAEPVPAPRRKRR